jgi:phosphoenolpyruvate synthase/pyruvate phosphate dikinase
MITYVLGFQDTDRTRLMLVGGKGANLGELSRIEGICVPEGFCVSTDAYRRTIAETPSIHELLDQISQLKLTDRGKIAEWSAKIRKVIEGIIIPSAIRDEISRHLNQWDAQTAFAVRSSATAEDLPTASFAGQQDTFLNIIDQTAILQHIVKCWASLFTERAVTYRLQNGITHRQVHMAVVVQKMVFPQASGIMFTADPVTSNRKVVAIDASFGLGESLVSGRVNADHFQVRHGKVIEQQISNKQLAVVALKAGGTTEQLIEPELQNQPTLAVEQIMQLAQLGRKIEAHFGCPQDIEWFLADETFYVVQSRPITTLFPIPHVNDQENHVYVSVGHQQMMTDPIKPLGLSFFLLTTAAPMRPAGGRLFVDVTHPLESPATRETLLATMGQSEPIIKDALMTLIERGDFIKSEQVDQNNSTQVKKNRAQD